MRHEKRFYAIGVSVWDEAPLVLPAFLNDGTCRQASNAARRATIPSLSFALVPTSLVHHS
jgi:hypothetical protein